jgi:outer membrane protein OmpA-like peptidoglycan-associated protein
MKKLLLSVFAFAFATVIMAQGTTNIKPAALAFKVSYIDFKKTNLTEGLTKNTTALGLQYYKGISKHFDFVTNLDFALLKYPFYTSLKIPKATSDELYSAIDFSVNYKFLTDDHKVVPYATLGYGVGYVASSYFTAYAPMGLGLQIKANEGSFIHLSSTYRAEASSPLTKMHFSHAISYSFPIKGKEKKAIALPPAPVAVDSDNDGVVDSLDKCPGVAGVAKYNGCPIPDTDNDGINDELDKCPGVAGVAKYNGCPIPDTDKDGINDEQDKCPTVPGLSRYNGCPIPDTDNDGVNDEVDKCPTVAGIAANNGCEDVQPLFTKVAANLKFATGKSVLSTKILANLDAVVAAMNLYPNVTVAVGGHTDNTGAERINKKLSNQRAALVAKYLVKKGIDKGRISQAGYAATMPIADNKTKAGRAQNRRVDMEVKY